MALAGTALATFLLTQATAPSATSGLYVQTAALVHVTQPMAPHVRIQEVSRVGRTMGTATARGVTTDVAHGMPFAMDSNVQTMQGGQSVGAQANGNILLIGQLCVAAASALVYYFFGRQSRQESGVVSVDLAQPSYAMMGVTGSKKSNPLLQTARSPSRLYSSAEKEAEATGPEILTTATGKAVPEMLKGTNYEVVMDLAGLRERLNGVSLCFIGMAGNRAKGIAGNISDALLYAPLDTYDVMTSITMETPAALLKRDGKEELQTAENAILAQVSAYRRIVVTTGSELPMEKYNWSHLRHFITIYLNMPADELAENLEEEGADSVFLFNSEVGVDSEGTLKERISKVLEERSKTYLQADLVIDASGGRPDMVALKVTQALDQLLEDNTEHVQNLMTPQEVKIEGA